MCLRVALLAATLVFAGCAAPFGAGGPDTSPNGTADVDAGASTTTPTATATNASNPWGKRTLTVGVVNTAGSWRDVTGHVADAIEYWERNDADYGRYEVEFDLRPNAADPDVVVRYVEDISVCGSPNYDSGAGFASRITADNPPDPPEYICVRTGFDEASTNHVVKHEFGHLLGIDHGDPPYDLMRANHEYNPIPRPNADVLAASRTRTNLSVYVDRSTVFARRDVVAQRQLESVFAYYERGASGTVKRDVTITEVDEREAADVAVTFPRQSPCDRNRPGSCVTLDARPDGEPQLRVAITTTHEDTFGWHAGFWLAVALGAGDHSDLPPPFLNASFDDRRREWWADDR